MSKLGLSDQVGEVIEDEEDLSAREKTKSRWAALEKLVGAEPRVREVAEDLVRHFEERTAVIDGKGMIVCMSREICVHLFNAIIAIRPEWANPELDKGAIKIVMTGSASDKPLLKPHIYSKQQKKRLEKRFKDPSNPMKLVIVRDMWLTGFDAPCVHTMYVDKPMNSHNLMQAIARVNRVFKNKPGGLVVDYIGIANELKRALKTYTESKGRGNPANLVQEKKYGDRLLETLRKYNNRAIETAQVIEELIAMAKEFQEAMKRHEDLGLNEDELAFYDALANNESAVRELGDDTLRTIAHELVEKLRNSVTVDWQKRESVRARLRNIVRILLRRYKYPPDKQDDAIDLVLRQAKVLSDGWSLGIA